MMIQLDQIHIGDRLTYRDSIGNERTGKVVRTNSRRNTVTVYPLQGFGSRCVALSRVLSVRPRFINRTNEGGGFEIIGPKG